MLNYSLEKARTPGQMITGYKYLQGNNANEDGNFSFARLVLGQGAIAWS